MRIGVVNSSVNYRQQVKKNEVTQSFSSSEKPSKSVSNKLKTGLLAGMFFLPAAGVVTSCSGDSKKINQEVTQAPADISSQSEYLKKGERTFYKVKEGDIPAKIADKFDVSTRRLLAENGMKKEDKIFPGDTLLVPESYKVKDVENVKDIVKLTGLSDEFLKDVIKMEGFHNSIYHDRNSGETIGIGHYIKPSEREKYDNVKWNEEKIFTTFAQDLLDRDLDLATIIKKDAFDEMPAKLKESVVDLVFNKGEGAVETNKVLLKALNEKDYVTAVSNLTQDYSIVTNAKGEKVKKPASGLSKRRLYDIQNASQIFENGMPKEVLKAAKRVYENGLAYMEAEMKRGEISKASYPHVKAEYQDLAYKWFDGKIGKKLEKSGEKVLKDMEGVNESEKVIKKSTDNSKRLTIDGVSTKWTVNSLHDEWQRNAKSKLRAISRPLPEIDKNGNITAVVKTYNPTGKGALNGKTIIVNPGHGGCMKKDGSANFDPGTSNAVMSRKNKNVETNVFKGNGGKSLEEWVVNKKIADDLVEKITSAGGKVVYVQGSVHTAQDAIRKLQRQGKISMIVSLHSNSDGSKRGIYVIGNKRGGVDKEDDKLTKIVAEKLERDSWFKGITKQTKQSLGVLSSSSKQSSSVPGMLIETGNLKNETDVANLNSRNFHDKFVDHTYDGIVSYFKGAK